MVVYIFFILDHVLGLSFIFKAIYIPLKLKYNKKWKIMKIYSIKQIWYLEFIFYKIHVLFCLHLHLKTPRSLLDLYIYFPVSVIYVSHYMPSKSSNSWPCFLHQ